MEASSVLRHVKITLSPRSSAAMAVAMTAGSRISIVSALKNRSEAEWKTPNIIGDRVHSVGISNSSFQSAAAKV